MKIRKSPMRYQLVAASLAWTLASACLAAPSGSAEDANVLRVWTRSSTAGRKTYDQIAAAFTAKSGIRIEFFNAVTDFEQRLARAAVAGKLPDVIVNDDGSLGTFIRIGVADEIDKSKLSHAEQLSARAWDGAQSANGKTYAVPISAQANVLFIRRDWREQLGLPVPQTWDQLAALAKAFTKMAPDSEHKGGRYGLVFPGATVRGYAAWYISNFLWQAGGDFVRPIGNGRFKAALDEPAAATTLTWFQQRLCVDKVMQPNAVNSATQEANRSFLSGQAGIYVSGPYHFALFDRSPGKDKIEVVPTPAGPGGMRAILAGGDLAYVVRSGTKKDMAYRFIDFLISPQGQTLGMKAPPGGLPVVRLPVNQGVDVLAVTHDARWQLVAQEYALHGHSLPHVQNWQRIQQIAADGFNDVLSRCSTTVEADLKEINQKLDRELARQKIGAAP